jgi:hypothetical protein
MTIMTLFDKPLPSHVAEELKRLLREGKILYQRYRCACGNTTNRYREDGKCPSCGVVIADTPLIIKGQTNESKSGTGLSISERKCNNNS